MLKIKKILFVLIAVQFSISAQNNNPDILVVLPEYFGANYCLVRDIFEKAGCDLTITGLNSEMTPCPWGAPLGLESAVVDILLTDITDITRYDGIAIMSGSRAYSDPCADLLGNQAALDLIHTANDNGIAIGAYCTAARVLAAADVINGVNVTGHQDYAHEYANAGGVYLGANIAPVVDGNIMTCSKGDYYHMHNAWAFLDIVESSMNKRGNTISEMKQKNGRNKEGDVIWETLYGGESSEGSYSLAIDSAGDIIQCGYTYSAGAGSADLKLVKTDEDGNLRWEKEFGGALREFGNSVIADEDDNIIAAGYTTSFGAGDKDFYLVKTGQDGIEIWTKTFGGEGREEARKIIETTDGHYLVMGDRTTESMGEDDIWFIKLDKDGNEVWSKTIGTTASDLAFDIKETSDGGFIITGASGYNSTKRQLLMLKTDGAGNEVWKSFFGEDDCNDWGFEVLEVSDGYVACGKADIHSKDFYNVTLLKTDFDGNLIWQKKYGSITNYDFGNSFCRLNDKSFSIFGIRRIFGSWTNLYQLITDENGELLYENVSTEQNSQWVSQVKQTEDGKYLVSGYSNNGGSGAFDFRLMKINTLFPYFRVNNNTGHAPLEVQFDNMSLGNQESVEWDFNGDGITDSQEESPSWNYTESGNYTVTLKISDEITTKEMKVDTLIRVFDGESSIYIESNDNYSIANSSSSLNLTDEFTFEAWIKPLEFTSGMPLFDKENISVFITGASLFEDECLTLKLKTDSVTTGALNTPTGSIVAGQWQHIAISYDRSGQISMLINGEEMEISVHGVSPVGAVKNNSDFDLIIGNNQSINKCFHGYIDEVRVWNKYRSSEEITETYDNYMNGNEAGLAAYWRVNEGNGNLTADLTGNDNDLSMLMAEWREGLFLDDPVFVKGEKGEGLIPGKYFLSQNYPNPFNPETIIEYGVPAEEQVSLVIYDSLGRIIKELINNVEKPGKKSVYWNGLNNNGYKVASGVYYYTLKTENFCATKKLLILK